MVRCAGRLFSVVFHLIQQHMCLYPRLIPNPKYKPNKSNGGRPPIPSDDRLTLVPIGCGKCIECRTQYAQQWRLRLYEEFKHNREQRWFVTLTFSEESLQRLQSLTDKEDINEVAVLAVKLFRERWRKLFGKSIRHWLITELGHDNTERLHLHGVIWCSNEQIKYLLDRWNYGWIHIGQFCNIRTINYIVKYVTKIDHDHEEYVGKVLTSPGIGAGYIKQGKQFNAFCFNETKEYYRADNGLKYNLPIYYRNHIYTELQREQLWLNKMDKQEIYCNKIRIDMTEEEGMWTYLKVLETQQKTNESLKYGKIDWNKEEYIKKLLSGREKTMWIKAQQKYKQKWLC